MSTVREVDTPPRRAWSDRKKITVFLILSFALSWWIWPLTLLNPTSTALLPYGPTITAILLTAFVGRRGDLRELLSRLVRWRVHPLWYLAAFGLPVVLFGLPVLVLLALGVPAQINGPFPWSQLALIFAVRTILGGPLGEELGWRGYLLPILRKRHGALAASVLISLVWIPFHLPAMVSGPVTDQRPVTQFLVWVVAASVLFTWMYERTGGSVLLVTLFHGALNTAASLFMPLFSGPAYGTVWWLGAATMVAAAALVVWRSGNWFRPQPEQPPATTGRPTVLIAGSGFGGFHAARELERRLPAEAADIVLASPDDHLTYGPLLPNVAAGVIEPRQVTVALHGELRRTRYLTGTLTALDLRDHTATLCRPDGDTVGVHWDRLVLAPGAVTRLPAIPGLAEHALGLKTMTAAIALRDHVIRQLNLADATEDTAERRARGTFVVVGAGYTGVEAAAQLQLFSRRALRRFPRLGSGDVRWVLVDVAGQVLTELGPFLGRRALSVLRRRGVEVRLRTTVEEVTEDAVRLSDGETLPAHTLIWAAGIKPEPVVERLGLPLENGRLRVEATLRVPGADGVYALGDAAAVPDLTRPGEFTAPTGQHAQRQGRAVARNIAASLGYGTERPYRHHDLGQAVDLGPFSGVARPLGLPLWGLPAALVTRGYHLLALPSAAGRVRVLLGWLLDLVVPPQLTRVGRTIPAGGVSV